MSSRNEALLLHGWGDIPIPSQIAVPDQCENDERPEIRVQSLGAARILVGAHPIIAQADVVFPILLRLVYSPSMCIVRDVLLAELWPNQPERRQRGNLRQALYKLRGMQVDIAQRGETVRLAKKQVHNTFSVERTIESFERDVTRGNEPFGTFLPGYVPSNSSFARWVEQTRDAVHADVRRVLVDTIRQRRQRGDWGAIDPLSRWLLQFDPLNEDGTLALAECTMLAGSKAEALGILDRYLADLGPHAGEIRLPAQLLRKRFTEPPTNRRPALATTERHFIGRDRELADLTMQMRRARWHDGSAVVLHGPIGIGKSRLLAEIAKVARIEGYREIFIECRESDHRRPLGGLLDALPDLLASPGALGCSPDSMAVLSRLAGVIAEPHCTEGELREAQIDKIHETSRSRSIRHAFLDLATAVSDEQPLMLSIDDVNWLDDETWEIVCDLVQRIRSTRIFILVTSRLGSIRMNRPSRVGVEFTSLALTPLKRPDCLALMAAIGSDLAGDPTAEIADWLINSSEGSPLLLRALFEHWIITGDAGGIPPTLVGLIEQRLDLLSSEALRTLQAVGLLGRFASLKVIRQVLQYPIHSLLSALEHLENAGCLANSQATLIVAHDLLERAARSRLTPLVEATLRNSASEVLEQEYLTSGDVLLLLEALHHAKASTSVDTLSRFIIRHERALLDCGHPVQVLSAVQLLHTASQISRIDSRIAHILSRLEVDAGEFGLALQVVPGAFIFPANKSIRTRDDADKLLTYIECAYRSDPIVDRIALGESAASVANRRSIPFDLRVRAADIGLVIAANTCDSSLAEACFFGLQHPNVVSATKPEMLRIGLLYHSVFGSIEAADSLALSVSQQASLAPASTGAITDLARAGYVFRSIGNVEAATEAFARAIELATNLGSPRRKEFPLWQLALISMETGNLPTAMAWTDKLMSIAATNGEETANDYLFGHLCQLSILKGDAIAASYYHGKCASALPTLPPIRSIAFVIALELGVKLLDSAWCPPPALLEVALDRFEKTSRYCASDFLASVLAECLIRRSDSDLAKAIITKYMTHDRRERSSPSARLSLAIDHLGLKVT